MLFFYFQVNQVNQVLILFFFGLYLIFLFLFSVTHYTLHVTRSFLFLLFH